MCPERPTFDPSLDNEEQVAGHDLWFRAKVQSSIDDPRPNTPHDQVMAEVQALIESKRNRSDAD